MAKTAKPLVSAKPPALTEAEKKALSDHLHRRQSRPTAPKVKIEGNKGNNWNLGPDGADPAVWQAMLERAFGTTEGAIADLLLSAMATTIWSDAKNPPSVPAINSVLAMMHGINPADEIEAMAASQMVSLHLATMECLKRAQLSGQTFDGRDMNLHHAARLTRAFTAQVEALSRYRGKGQQKVVVEHVHVHSGGQAIVGTVAPNAGGRGTPSNSEDQPHAQTITHEPVAPVWCQNEARDAVPVTRGGGTEALPDARWG